MNIICTYCGDKGFKCENKGTIGKKTHFVAICYSKGSNLPQNLTSPEDESVCTLYTGENTQSKYFCKDARKFNSGIVMASM